MSYGADYIKCSACGWSYYPKDHHDCPGTPEEQAERLDRLEDAIAEEIDLVADLRRSLSPWRVAARRFRSRFRRCS